MRIVVLAIDPGSNGAIAWRDADGNAATETMPETVGELWDTLADLAHLAGVEGAKIVAYLEKVGTYHPGNHVGSACKFARHCGHVEMALYGCGIGVCDVSPAVWQRAVCGALSKDKAERKRQIREAMQRLYPDLKVTLGNADALGILTYARDKGLRASVA